MDDEVRELEAVKLIRLRQGLERLANSYEDLGSRCQLVFSAQRQLARLLPDPGNEELESLRYEGQLAVNRFSLTEKM